MSTIAPGLFADDRASAIERVHVATALYTTESVIDGLLDRINWPASGGALLDSSCGDGAFLARALDRLIASGSFKPENAGRSLRGWEIHPVAARQARERLAEIIETAGWPATIARQVANDIVEERDFLTDGPKNDEKFDIVTGNPPYLRRVNVPTILRDEYDRIVPDYAQGDLLHAFLDSCAQALAPDGIIALVTADRWLMNAGASRLRAKLGRRFTIAHLTRLDAATSFYRPKHRREGSPPRVHPIEIIMHKKSRGGKTLGRTAIFPDTTETGAHLRTLGQVAKVSIAPWLGSPGIFLVDASTARRLPPEYLVPAVDTDDLRVDGGIAVANRYAIRTRADQPPHPLILDHLHSELHRMAPRGRMTPEWLPPENWTDESLERDRLAIPCIAKALRVVRLPRGILAVSHNVTVIDVPGGNIDEIAETLASKSSKSWIAARAAPIEGGYMRITTTLLKSLPYFAESTSAKT